MPLSWFFLSSVIAISLWVDFRYMARSSDKAIADLKNKKLQESVYCKPTFAKMAPPLHIAKNPIGAAIFTIPCFDWV